MPVSGSYSNYGQVGQQYQQNQQDKIKNRPTQSQGLSYTSVTIAQDGTDFSNYGVRYEASNEAHRMSMLSFDGLAGATVAGNTSGNFHSSVGLGAKANVNLGDYIALYGTATGTANYTNSDGDSSFGVGYRLAYGAEIKAGKAGIYGEMFTEKATNYNANGYAVGAKIYF